MSDDPQKRLLDAVTASGYKAGSLAAQLTPGPVAQAAASFLGVGLSQGMRSRRSMIERHLQRVNPSLEGFALRRAVQGAFDSYARYWVESFKVPTLSKRAVERAFTTEGYTEHVLGALEHGKGVVVALPHLGGWEWAGRWLADQGHRVSVVVEPLDNKELFDWFVELRSKLGMHVIPLGPEAGPTVIRALKANEIVCLLSDRDIQRTGVEVEFFGERTTLPAGPATVALRTGAALVPTATYFTDRYNGHHAVVRPPIPTQRRGRLRDDVTRITQHLARELELLIGRAPEQWHLFQPNWPSDPGYYD
ncbi:MAG: phosphatidylinositol mannoside acyltransferase [Acidimicrobiia bacterium]